LLILVKTFKKSRNKPKAVKQETRKKIREIKKQVLSEIKPEKEPKRVKESLSKINCNIKNLGIDADAVVGGSYAKNTHLKNDHDCDIFVRFSKKYDEGLLPEMLSKILKGFSPIRVKGSRDYFYFREASLVFEVVPVIRISKPEEAKNTTDASPFHVDWLSQFPDVKDEIRVAKLFMKAQKVYGAESYINGFSGHVVDLLLAHYKSFEKLVEEASKWTLPLIIDIEKHYKRKDPLFYMNKEKVRNQFVVVDPICRERNAAAALSTEKIERFKLRCKEFLEKPEKSFFNVSWLNEKKILSGRKRENTVIIKALPFEKKSPDVAGTKAFKVYQYVLSQMAAHGFIVKDSGFEWNKIDPAIMFIELKSKKIEKTKITAGPPDKKKFSRDIEKFKKKHPSFFIKGGKYYAKVKREHTDAEKLAMAAISEKRIKEKCEKIWVEK